MRGLVLAAVSLLSWFGGAIAYRAALYWIWGERPSRGDFSAVSFWTLLLFLALVPFHIRSVSLLTRTGLSASRRLLGAAGWTLMVAIGSAALLSALLGRGRISDVLSPQGQLFLAWFSATALLFGALGAAAYHLGWWIEPEGQTRGVR